MKNVFLMLSLGLVKLDLPRRVRNYVRISPVKQSFCIVELSINVHLTFPSGPKIGQLMT